MQEKVLMLRQEICQYLLFHHTNKKSPALKPVNESSDEDDDNEECLLITNSDAATSGSSTGGRGEIVGNQRTAGKNRSRKIGLKSSTDFNSPPVKRHKRMLHIVAEPMIFDERKPLPVENCLDVFKIFTTKL
jgi:hypothetical protein